MRFRPNRSGLYDITLVVHSLMNLTINRLLVQLEVYCVRLSLGCESSVNVTMCVTGVIAYSTLYFLNKNRSNYEIKQFTSKTV